MKIIDNVSKKYSLCEAGQGKKEVKFAIIDSKSGETITPFCKCKDYFTDMFWSNAVKKDVSIFGFKWKPNQDNGVLDKQTFTIAIKLRDRDTGSNIAIEKKNATTIRALLNKFERKLKFKLSKAILDSDESHIILTVPKGWSDKPYLVSALFFLIRLGFSYDGKENPIEFFTKAKSGDYYSPHDESYFRTAKKKLEDLLEGKIDKKQTYEMYTSGTIHSYSGIVGYKDYSI